MKRYLGKSVRELVLPRYTQVIDETIEIAFKSGGKMHLEVETYAPDGSITWDSVRIGPIKQRGTVVSLSIIMIEITEHKRYEEKLIHDAFHDQLTDLPNRALFLDRLGHLMAHDFRNKAHSFAVLFLDMDHFKDINDSLGHSAGDAFLIEVANRLESSIREVDTIARLGGDEFVILLEDVETIHDVTETCSRIQSHISRPYIINDNEIVVSGSIGVVFSNQNYRIPEEYLRDADIAMYRAKEQGRSRYEIFDESMRLSVIERLEMEAALRRAISNQEFILFYQPIVELITNQIIGFEALVRWELPGGKIAPPALFIPIAEETRMIHQVGQWVLLEACKQLNVWMRANNLEHPLLMNVNVSGVQLMAPKFLEVIEKVLHETGIDPGCLILEITESALIKDQQAVADILSSLKKLGLKIYLDDFGTGYSSLSFLNQFPIDALKIDRQFVAKINHDDQVNLVSIITTLANEFKLKVVAEGIETAEQLAFIKDLDCQFGQGYYYSKPVDAHAANHFLQNYPNE